MSIKVNNIFHTYFKKTPNAVLALNDVSLEIKEHEFVAFVGETGSGKSTLVQHLNALLLPDQGTLEVNGFTITPNKRKNKKLQPLRKAVGLIFQFPEYQLFEETVLKDVTFGPRNFGFNLEEATQKAKEALALVGIDESYYERSPFELSGGERRKVAIAGILAIDPDVLVLDEPTAGLDYQASDEIMELVYSMYLKGKTIILVTHDMNLVYKYASKAFYIENAKIAFEGTPIELFQQGFHALEIPRLFFLTRELNKRGYHIPFDQVHSVQDVMDFYIKEGKHD